MTQVTSKGVADVLQVKSKDVADVLQVKSKGRKMVKAIMLNFYPR